MGELRYKIGDTVYFKPYMTSSVLKGRITRVFPFHQKYRILLEDGDEYIVREDLVASSYQEAREG